MALLVVDDDDAVVLVDADCAVVVADCAVVVADEVDD